MFNPLDQNGDMTADYMLYSTSVVITQKKKGVEILHKL